jgi:3-hydroxy-9,10-secoandrosta-1,3,5(10)-triene-9,17-dione monooxygenase
MSIVHRLKGAEDSVATGAQLVRRAEDMIPELRRRAGAVNENRALLPESLDALRSSGLARLLQPKRFGGAEGAIRQVIDILIPVSSGCPSTAWCLAQYLMHNFMIARWAPEAQEEVWHSSNALVSGIIVPRRGAAVAVDGGYRVSGRWPFVSGVQGSDWCLVGAMVERRASPDEERYFLVPTAEVSVLDTWHSIGLRGSGSQDVELHDHFVREAMSLSRDDLKGGESPGTAVNTAAVFKLPVQMTFGLLLAAPLIGMAEAMFEIFLSQSRRRRSLMSGEETASYATHQMEVGEISASLQAAEALLHADAQEMMELAESGRTLTPLERSNYRCNGAFAGRLACKAAQSVWDLVGARGAYADNPIAGIYQDVAVASRHTTMNWPINATEHGRTRLRLPLTNASL